jgi:hypothetical protein
MSRVATIPRFTTVEDQMARVRKQDDAGDATPPNPPGRPGKGKQVNVRLSQEIIDDLDLIERAHGLDTSSAIRMILTETRKPLVDRARRILKDREEEQE